MPVVTLHTTGDTAAQVEQERASGAQDLLSQLGVRHVQTTVRQTGAELLIGSQVLLRCIETGSWGLRSIHTRDMREQAHLSLTAGPWLLPFRALLAGCSQVRWCTHDPGPEMVLRVLLSSPGSGHTQALPCGETHARRAIEQRVPASR